MISVSTKRYSLSKRGGIYVNILIVEDDELTAEFIKRVLEKDKHFVRVINDGEKGFNKAKTFTFDAIILDILLPSKDGLSICRDLRRLKLGTPILILSSHSDESTKVSGLDAGADDYLVKPFNHRELLARLRAITRRPSIVSQSSLNIGGLTLNPESREVTREGKLLKLRPKEYELLEYMMRNPDVALPRYLLLSKVWQIRSEATSNRLEVYIRSLRQKVDHPFNKNSIQTVRGIGYKFVET